MAKMTRLVLILGFSMVVSASSVVLSQHREGRGRIETECRIVCVTQEDNGSTIELEPGDFVHLLLVTNTSTGFAWHIEQLDDQVFRSLCHASIPQGPLMGAPSDLKWFFDAVGPGETDLVLKYYRIWDGSASAIDTFLMHVIVEQ
jgi:predicted secreted protein